MTFLVLILLGIPAGILSSLLGIGGGIIIIPCLHFLFPAAPSQLLIASGLGIIFFSNLSTLYHYQKLKLKSFKSIKISMAVFSVLGAGLGSHLSFLFSKEVLKLFFAIALIFSSVKQLFFFHKKSLSLETHIGFSLSLFFLSTGAAFFAGTFSSLTGLGGGIVVMPILLSYGFSLIHASQYSNLVILVGTLSGLINYSLMPSSEFLFSKKIFETFQIGQVNFLLIFLVIPASVLGAKIGTILSLKLNQRKLQIGFAVFQLLVALSFIL